MPFTPFHLGPILLALGIAVWFKPSRDYWKKNVYFWIALTLGAILPDIDGIYVLFISHTGDFHEILHSVGGIIVMTALYSGGVLLLLLTSKITNSRDFHVNYRLVLYQSLIGYFIGAIILHLFIDLLIYDDIAPLWPFDSSVIVLWGQKSINQIFQIYREIAFGCMFAGIIGSILIATKLFMSIIKNN